MQIVITVNPYVAAIVLTTLLVLLVGGGYALALSMYPDWSDPKE